MPEDLPTPEKSLKELEKDAKKLELNCRKFNKSLSDDYDEILEEYLLDIDDIES